MPGSSPKSSQVLFKDKGRDLPRLDCGGLVRYLLLHGLGVALPSYTEDYGTLNEGKARHLDQCSNPADEGA